MPAFAWIFVSKILEVWQDSPQDGACFAGHRLEQSGVPILVVGRQSTEWWSKRLSSFQTIWDRGSGSECTLDYMWPSICIARIQMWPFESEKGTGGLILSMFCTLGMDHTEAAADIYDNQCGFNRPPKKTLPQSLPSRDFINTENLAVHSCFT